MKIEYILNDGYLQEMEENGDILVFIKPTLEEKNFIKENFDISDHDISSSLDEEELPRLDDEEKFFFIWKYPRNFMNKSDFEISSIGFFVRYTKIILITDYNFDYFKINKIKYKSSFDIILRFMEFTIKHYGQHLKITKAMSKEIERKMNTSMENKYLVQMFNLSESLIYYQSSLALNYDAIVKLHLYSKRNNFTEITINSLENLKIENEQALKQAEIYSEVFSGLMDARASIVNNNMNQLMKKLTIINIIFLPLNLIAGIFGMSEFTTLIGTHNIVIGYLLFFIGLALTGIITYKILIKIEKREKGKKK